MILKRSRFACSVTGTPTVAGPFAFVVKATDSGNPAQVVTGPVAITIAPANLNLLISVLPNGTVNANGTTNPNAINPDDLSVRATEELRFMLFRHWTLYDAMYHSSYVAGKLGIWKERGRKRLTGLLAKMGYVYSPH